MSDPVPASVADLMAPDLPAVPDTTPAFEVARRMVQERLRHVLVERDGRLVGIVDRAALLRHLVAHYRHPDGRAIADFVLRDPVTIAPGASAAEAMALMRQHHIGSLPVLDGGRLVGLLSERRLLVVAEAVITRAVPASSTP